MEVKDPQKEEIERRKIAWRIIAPRLEIAEEAAVEAIQKRSKQVTAFFEQRQTYLSAYAQRVLSFKSKWELSWSKMPGADKEGHAKFLKDEFAKIVFDPADLTKAITAATEDYVRDINAVENALLIKIRADIEAFPECAAILASINTEELFRARFSTAVKDLSSSTGTDLQVGGGQLVASEIGAFVAIQVAQAVATRLGVSAGIIGSGTHFAPETLGASILAGIVVDQIVGWVVSWFYDPAAEIEAKLRTQLQELSNLIVKGDKETRGLVNEFTTLAQERKLLREKALRQVILDGHPYP